MLEPAFNLPHTQLIYSRPQLNVLLSETVDLALAPCRMCFPVCNCGTGDNEGTCANDEEECCGNGPANGRELLEKNGADDDDKKDEKAGELDDVPELASCCKSKKIVAQVDEDEITEVPGPSSCCASTKVEGSSVVRAPACGGGCCAATGSGCCSGGVEGASEKVPTGPLRIRTGGLGVVVCGPGEMIVSCCVLSVLADYRRLTFQNQGELRNAVARVPLAKQARIGGIDLHSEHFAL